jgi:hypothetical protein
VVSPCADRRLATLGQLAGSLPVYFDGGKRLFLALIRQPVLKLLAPISPQHKSTLHSPPLVDAQGFPRSDIDVYAIRHARTALIRARNDREAIVDELARCLEVVFAAGGKVEKGEQKKEDAKEKRKPMARVNQVSSGSPAHTAVRLATAHFGRFLLALFLYQRHARGRSGRRSSPYHIHRGSTRFLT